MNDETEKGFWTRERNGTLPTTIFLSIAIFWFDPFGLWGQTTSDGCEPYLESLNDSVVKAEIASDPERFDSQLMRSLKEAEDCAIFLYQTTGYKHTVEENWFGDKYHLEIYKPFWADWSEDSH
jgi:hypothetical protein